MLLPDDNLTSDAPIRDKVVTAADAVQLVRDGDVVVIEGFAGQCYAEELVLALEDRFLQTGHPGELSLVFAVAQGDRAGRGVSHLCHDGMLRRSLGGHYGLAPELQRLAVEGRIEAYNFPQGVVAHLLRDTGANKPGVLTKVGLGTFADPRNGGGKVNERTTEDRVRVMEIDGEEFLFYRSFESLDVALLRGTTADPQGNVTLEREALTLESLEIAIAVHNRGGLVIVQVERLAESGALSPKDVKIPGILVDCVVVAARPEHHTQTWATTYDPGMSGELRVPTGALAPMPLDVRKVIARRAAMELRPNSVVNLGIGVPEGIAAVAAEEGVLKYVTLTTEPGVIGGLPLGGLDFGSALNAEAILAQPSQFDFYDGGGLDAAFLGMAQADRHGNVNVSRFGPRLAGAGGFVNISQNSKSVFFLGTFLAPARAEVRDGRIVHTDGMAAAKFIADVEQCTFAASNALITGQPVMYITERCVFQLTREGMALVEVAPGVDLERDVLAHLGFTPVIRRDPVTMDPRIFVDEPMGLRQDLLSIPVEARFAYDPERNTFFLNMEGMVLSAPAQVEEIGALVDARLAAIGHRVNMVVNYDNFVLARDLGDQYAATVRGLTEKYYESVRRYSTSAFMRLKLTDQLGGRGLAPHVYESRAEALAWVDDRRPIAPPNPA